MHFNTWKLSTGFSLAQARALFRVNSICHTWLYSKSSLKSILCIEEKILLLHHVDLTWLIFLFSFVDEYGSFVISILSCFDVVNFSIYLY